MPHPQVMLFSLSTCSHCKATKRFLDEAGVTYDYVDVDLLKGEERNATVEEVKKINPKCSFPTMKIKDAVVVGFKENEIKEALGL